MFECDSCHGGQYGPELAHLCHRVRDAEVLGLAVVHSGREWPDAFD